MLVLLISQSSLALITFLILVWDSRFLKSRSKLPSAVIDSNVFAEKAFAYIKINWLTKILLSSPKRARKI
ncbi:Uncharacterised protein [Vibrio cholerae]|uniref:Uncharacterized protein n=1 Tax=Vibrio cholerae TaxID=666 RepID=A0A656A1S6_VIBCL|nr:Uncharacterised protein [Vibrio cholerae]